MDVNDRRDAIQSTEATDDGLLGLDDVLAGDHVDSTEYVSDVSVGANQDGLLDLDDILAGGKDIPRENSDNTDNSENPDALTDDDGTDSEGELFPLASKVHYEQPPEELKQSGYGEIASTPPNQFGTIETLKIAIQRRKETYERVTLEVENFVGKVDPDTSLFTYGVTSKTTQELSAILADAFNVKLDRFFINDHNTVSQMAEHIRQQVVAQQSKPLK